MKENIDADNVLDIIMLADNYSYEDLKTAAMDYIMKNVKIIMTSSKWKDLSKELMQQILENVVSKHVK